MYFLLVLRAANGRSRNVKNYFRAAIGQTQLTDAVLFSMVRDLAEERFIVRAKILQGERLKKKTMNEKI